MLPFVEPHSAVIPFSGYDIANFNAHPELTGYVIGVLV